MTNYDFLSIYFPSYTELDSARVLEMREAVGTLVRSVYPDVDTAPNSPFGDLFVSPAAPGLAAAEVAFNRLLSDLDPENVENGTAYNCDFLRQFYLNLGIQDEESQRSYGILRLVFSDNTTRELDRSTTFLINDGSYRPFAPKSGPVMLMAPGLTGGSNENYLNYSFFSEGSWVVDVLVFGNAGQLATAGASVEVDRTVDGLTAATALSNFEGGTTPSRLQELARRTRHNFYSRTPTTRGGATNLIHQQFPEMTLTGCVVSGDFEMVRDLVNPAQVAAGCLDLMVRSETLFQDMVTVRLRQTADAEGNVIYSGWADLPETPIKFLSFINNQLAQDVIIYSVSTDPKTPGLTAAYGASERLMLRVPYAEDGDGNPMIRTQLDEDGTYADFTVTYLFDPNLKICQEFIKADDNVPAGLSLYTRWFVPVDVELMEVDFNRKAGTTLNLEAARADILSAFNSHRFEQPAGAAVIDAAFYYAGAHSVNGVDIAASIRYSTAYKVWVGTEFVEPVDQATWAAFTAQCVDVPVIPISTVYNPPFENSDTASFAVSGKRNVSYLLSSSNLKLTERRSV